MIGPLRSANATCDGASRAFCTISRGASEIFFGFHDNTFLTPGLISYWHDKQILERPSNSWYCLVLPLSSQRNVPFFPLELLQEPMRYALRSVL
jgi:hypothetical protein